MRSNVRGLVFVIGDGGGGGGRVAPLVMVVMVVNVMLMLFMAGPAAGVDGIVIGALRDEDYVGDAEVTGECDGGWRKAREESAWEIEVSLLPRQRHGARKATGDKGANGHYTDQISCKHHPEAI
jgi:hypothetical protein